MTRSRAALLTLVTLLGLVAPAAAERRRIVGILDVKVAGVPKEIAAQFQTNLEKRLDSRAYWLATKARMHEMLEGSTKWTEGCLVGACLHEVKAQTGAELVLLASITGADTSFGYVVTLVRTDTGRTLSQEADRCDVCTVNEALTNATQAAVKLLTAVPETLPDDEAELKARLAIETEQLQSERTKFVNRHRTLAMTLTVIGVVVAGAGLTMYFLNDEPDYAMGVAGVGGGMTLSGVVALTF